MKILLIISLIAAGYFFYQSGGSKQLNDLSKIPYMVMTTNIDNILKDQRGYERQTVTVSGTVTTSVNLGLKFYVINDGTGEIYISTKKAVPRNGEKITVTGKFSQFAAIGGMEIALITEQP